MVTTNHVSTATLKDFTVSLSDDKQRIHLRVGRKTYSLGLSKAFSFAHELLCQKKYDAAAQICEALVQSGNVGARAVILLACCKAGLNKYPECNELLKTAFAAESAPVAEGLQAAFVYSNIGMWPDAVAELAKVVQDRPDLPSTCLLLGDLLAELGQKEKAIRCWRLAFQRDQPNGSVAREAEKEIASALKQGELQDGSSASEEPNGKPNQ